MEKAQIIISRKANSLNRAKGDKSLAEVQNLWIKIQCGHTQYSISAKLKNLPILTAV